MSIDYERIGELLDDFNQAESHREKWVVLEVLRAHAGPMARELLRLRRELTDLRGLMHTHAQYLGQDGLRTAAEYAYDHALRLTRILDGDVAS